MKRGGYHAGRLDGPTMGYPPARSNPMLPVAALMCFYAVRLFHDQARKPEVAPSAPPPATAASVPREVPQWANAPNPVPEREPRRAEPEAPPPPASRPVAAPPPPRAERDPADEAPRLVYTGMMKMGGKPMALFAGHASALPLGAEIDGEKLLAIRAESVSLVKDGHVRVVAVDTDPIRHVGAPPPPPQPMRQRLAWQPPRPGPDPSSLYAPVPTGPIPVELPRHQPLPPDFPYNNPPPGVVFGGAGSGNSRH